jgi:hypothetical protein
MTRKLLIFLLACVSIAGQGQDLTISAKVLDKETNEALGYASVGIKGVPVGTISNNWGEFDFHFSSDYRNDILVISMVGYKNYEAPIWTLLSNTVQTIHLEKSTIELQEIVVSDTLTGGDILRIALSRIDKNYPMQPFLLEGFYRDVKKVGGTYISLLEAAVKIYDESYEAPRNKFKLRERVRLVEVRKSIGYESKFTKYFDQTNLLEDLLLHNNIRYRQFEEDDELFASMKRDQNSVYNDREIYVVTRNEIYNLKVYIDKEDFSIIHLEWETIEPGEDLGKKKNLISQFAGLKKSMDFRRHAGKMYLSFMSMTSKVNWYDLETTQLKFQTELIQQLLVNTVHPNSKERIGSTEKMRNYGLQYQDQPYNKKFWDRYNVIKETPLDSEVLADLEKLAPLDKQFEEY